MATRFGRRSELSVREQAARLRLDFPDFETRVRGSWLISEGKVRPSPLSATYRVELRYAVGKPPEVRVLSPPLRCREGATDIPHMYGQKRLCLYLPGSGEWSSELPLGRTFLPWISLWLYFYEVWHATGEWLGGGVEPLVFKEPLKNERLTQPFDKRSRRGR